MNVLVTGATGVVGSRVVPRLVAGGHRVTAIGRSHERLAALERQGAATSCADLFDPESFLRDMIRIVRRGWVPMPGAPESFVSSVSHDDAATAAVAALALGAGTCNVADDEPVSRRDYFDTLAAALGAPPPEFPPPWTARLLGSAGELMSRSQRISNRKLKTQSGWAPGYPSVREGWRAIVPAMENSRHPAAA